MVFEMLSEQCYKAASKCGTNFIMTKFCFHKRTADHCLTYCG